MTADVIVAGPLDSDCNCEYPPPSICRHFLPSSKRKNFSPLSPVMFKPFMLLCGRVGRVHNEVSTRDQRKEREKTHTDWKTDLNERRLGWGRAERYCLGVRGRNIYIWLKLHYERVFVLTGHTKDVLRKCYCWLCDIFYFFSNQYFSTALNFTFFFFSLSVIWYFNSIYSYIVTVSPDTIKRCLFRSVLMLVITLQFSYMQETIYTMH